MVVEFLLGKVPGVARGINKKREKIYISAFVIPWITMGSLKKFQQIWFSRLARYS